MKRIHLTNANTLDPASSQRTVDYVASTGNKLKSTSLILGSLILAWTANAEDLAPIDTTFTYSTKTVNISDNEGEVHVKIFDSVPETDAAGSKTVEYKQVYEGVFSDDKSYEKFSVAEDLGFQLPGVLSKKEHKHHNRMEGHWTGFGVGLSSICDPDFKLATFNGARMNTDKSFEWILNTNEFVVPVISDVIGFTTGFGFDWRNYYMEDHQYLQENSNVVSAFPYEIPNCTYKSGRLRTLHLNVPLFLEIQPHFCDHQSVFLTAGVVAGYKAFANFKYKWIDEDGDVHTTKSANGLNMPPLTLDYMVQAGIKDYAIYAKYSPYGMFRKGEGPDVHTLSIGIVLNFND